MFDEVKLITLILKFRRNHSLSINSCDTEGHEHWRYVDILECTAHRVLTTD